MTPTSDAERVLADRRTFETGDHSPLTGTERIIYGWYAAACDALAAVVDENKALADGLLALTPGGSEYVNDPKRCLEFVKERMATVMKVAVENKAQAERIRVLEADLLDTRAALNVMEFIHGDEHNWASLTDHQKDFWRRDAALAAAEPRGVRILHPGVGPAAEEEDTSGLT